jgi:hypothetical protein
MTRPPVFAFAEVTICGVWPELCLITGRNMRLDGATKRIEW